MKTIYGIENFTKFVTENNLSSAISNYQTKQFEEDKVRFAGFIPVCELIQAFQFRESNEPNTGICGAYYLDHVYTVALYKGVYIKMRGNYNDKTFSLSLCESINSDYLSEFHLTDYGIGEAPAKIGKATESKLNNWMIYLNAVELAKKDHIAKVTNKVNAFLESLSAYEDVIKWNKWRTSGSIIRGGMEYSFSIDNRGGISQEVKKSHLVGNSLSSFLSISDNKYTNYQNIL